MALILLFWTPQVFSLSASFPPSVAQCSEFSVKFSGSVYPPFTLLLLPTRSSSPEIIPIPEDAWDNTTSQGSFNARLSFPTGTEFISVLHDSRGRGTGVVSDLYIVEHNLGDIPEGCARQPRPSESIFTLTPSPPTQCDVQALSWDPSRLNVRFGGQCPSREFLNPLNFTSYIPGGQAFRLGPISTARTTSQAVWVVNIAAGLRYISLLEYYDRDGAPIRETSSLQQVQPPLYGNADCLGPDSPTITTALNPSFDVASSQSSLAPTTTTDPDASERETGSTGILNNTRDIVILIGGYTGVLILIVAISYFVCYRCRRRRNQDEEINDGAIKVNLDMNEPASLNETKSSERRNKTPEEDGLALFPTIEKLHRRNPTRNPTRKPQRVRQYISSIASWGNLGPLPA
ncbi:hypothetical protein FRC18_011121 [Serendipita sp. 400]|nr:hypothetical protein FRC18_011121 [Serendipita sp. 400]